MGNCEKCIKRAPATGCIFNLSVCIGIGDFKIVESFPLCEGQSFGNYAKRYGTERNLISRPERCKRLLLLKNFF